MILSYCHIGDHDELELDAPPCPSPTRIEHQGQPAYQPQSQPRHPEILFKIATALLIYAGPLAYNFLQS